MKRGEARVPGIGALDFERRRLQRVKVSGFVVSVGPVIQIANPKP